MIKEIKILVFLFYAFIASLSFWSCEKPTTEKLTLIKKFHISYEDSTFTHDAKKAYKGSGYNHLDRHKVFGDDFFYELPDSLLCKDIRIYIKGFIRTNNTNAKHSIIISLKGKNRENYRWHQMDTRKYCNVADQWCIINDSTQIPRGQNIHKNASLEILGFGPKYKSTFDLDELEITLKVVEQIERAKN